MWNVDRETSTLCVNLEKAKEIMWKSVLEGEEAIDLTKVQTSQSLSGAAAEGGQGERLPPPPNIPIGGLAPPNKIGAMTT